MRKILLVILAFALIVPASVMAADAPKAEGTASAAKMYKDVTLKNLTGDDVKLSSLFGEKGTVLVYANSACSACRSEGALLRSKFKNIDDYSFVFIIIDMTGEAGARKYMKATKLGDFGTVLLDPEFSTGEYYGIYFTPGLVLINKAGEVAGIHTGYRPVHADAIVEKINSMK